MTNHMEGLADLDLVPILFLTGLLVPAADRPLTAQALTSPSWSEIPVSIRYLRLTI